MTDVLALLLSLAPTLAQCPEPTPSFAPTDLTGPCYALLQHDDGFGRELFAGGAFTAAGESVATGIAKWNGARWASVGGGVAGSNANVRCLARFDAGFGTDLIAGGEFAFAGDVPAQNVARWDGSQWNTLGAGFDGPVLALAVWNDGSGPKLYAGGAFTTSGTQAVAGIARFDGSAWQPVGAGVAIGASAGIVRALEVHDDGNGTRLYAGGNFTTAGGAPANHVARWNGAAWSNLGSGFSWSCCSQGLFALESFDDGGGPRLYAGGSFMQAGGVAANKVARWNGASWSSLPFTMALAGEYVEVFDFEVFDDGGGPALYVAGENVLDPFVFGANTIVVRWRSGAWEQLGSAGVGFDARALAVFDDGGGARIHAGGSFTSADGAYAGRIARFDGAAWSNLDVNDGLVGGALTTAVFDFGAGPELVVAGNVQNFGVVAANVARWNGSSWTAMPAPFTTVRTLGVHDVGAGPELFVGGSNLSTTVTLMRWQVGAWQTIPGAPSGIAGSVYVASLASYDDGSGNALYVAGRFTSAGATSAKNVARFDGTTWSTVGAQVFDDNVNALCVFDDGSGTKLYAGGIFQWISGSPAPTVARWDGASWQSFGAGIDFTGDVARFVPFDDGGPGLVAVGRFDTAGGAPAKNVARWDGSSWSAIGAGLSGVAGGHVFDARVLDAGDGAGPRLVATGSIDASGFTPLTGLVRWDGAQWSSLDPGFVGAGNSLALFDDGSGQALYVAGQIARAGGFPVSNLARYELCASVGTPTCFGDGSGAACPCGNASPVGANAGCLNSFGSGGKLVAQGQASIGADSLTLVGSGMTNSSVLYFQGTSLVAGGAGVVFGDGLRCAGGSVLRLDTLTNSGGASQLPGPGDPTLAVDGAVLPGASLVYQAWYRNAASFCTPAAFNLTNALVVVWGA